jgi:hypothetical protein
VSSDVDRLLARHPDLVHMPGLRVSSHVQRKADGWMLNTVMVDGYSLPFRFKRRKTYRDLAGSRVNLTGYLSTESVAGIEIEVMKVVRIRAA